MSLTAPEPIATKNCADCGLTFNISRQQAEEHHEARYAGKDKTGMRFVAADEAARIVCCNTCLERRLVTFYKKLSKSCRVSRH